MREITKQELKQILKDHADWLTNSDEGKRANLSEYDLRKHVKYLSYANLSYADLLSANLSSANLSYADLRSANLSYANLSYADLSYANLSEIKEDFFNRISAAKAEVSGLYDYLQKGRIDGSSYEGECSCFCGTIAKIRSEDYQKMGIDLHPNSESPTERWFMGIRRGDTPLNNEVSRIIAEWIEEFCKTEEIELPKYKIVSSLDAPQAFQG